MHGHTNVNLLFSFSISSQQASIFKIPCPVVADLCSFQSLSSDTLMSASASPSPFSQLQNRQGSLPCLGLRFRSFLKGALFPNFTKMVQRAMTIRGVQQRAENFSIVRTN